MLIENIPSIDLWGDPIIGTRGSFSLCVQAPALGTSPATRPLTTLQCPASL